MNCKHCGIAVGAEPYQIFYTARYKRRIGCSHRNGTVRTSEQRRRLLEMAGKADHSVPQDHAEGHADQVEAETVQTP